MKRWKKLLSFALALAMIAGVTADHLHYLKAKAADESLTPTGIKGDANWDGRLSVSDLVRASVALSDGSRPCSIDAMFTNSTNITSEDIPLLRNRLLYNAAGSVTVNVTGVDSNASVTVTRENDGVPVYSGTGNLSMVLPIGNYVVNAESDTVVAKTQRFRLDGDNPAMVDVETITKLEAATYAHQWGNTEEFIFEPDNGIYRGTYGMYNTGVLKIPGDVKNVEEWVLEADVQIVADWQYPSVGFALYNGSDFSQNVKFEIVRATLGTYETRSSVWQLRVNGKDYAPNAEGNSTEKWVAANQETLQGKVHMAVVHINGEYRMFINGIYLCGITGDVAANLVNGWGSVRPGFYAEQEATFENWSYSTDVTKYIRLESAPYTINGGTWTADTVDFIYEENTGIYRGTYGKFNTGMLEIPADVKGVNEWALEADVQIIADWQYPSVGFALYNGSNYGQNVKFEIVRATLGDYATRSSVWQLRVNGKDYASNAEGNNTEKWVAANQETLQDKVHLAVIYVNGEYMMFINGSYLCAITGDTAANLTNGWGSVRLGFYAEQEATIENWSYFTDVSKYARLESAPYTIDGGSWTADTVDFIYEENAGLYRGTYGKFNTGVLNIPGDVENVKEWALEADVQIIADWQYPSVGFALYNGSNYGQNVKFEIVRATASPDDKENHERLVRMNGINYVGAETGNGTVHSDWVAANQETLKGKVHLAVVHFNGEYRMFINGVYLGAITGDVAANLTNGWGSVRLGFYAEQEATIENWSYSTDVSKYARLESAPYTINGGTWTANTVDFIYEGNTGIYRGAYGFFNTGMLERPINVKAVNEWVLEADVQIIADWQWPSIGFALYNESNPGENVKFEIVRATNDVNDKENHERLVRMNGVNYVRGDAGGGAVHSDWVAANQETLKGKVHLALVHKDGKYGMFINGVYICAITGDAAANLTNSWGNVRLGFYAEQEATIENWKYSIDVSKYNIVD